MSSDAPEQPDPTIVALGRAVERTVRKVNTLDQGVRALSADVAAIAAGLAKPGNDPEASGVRSWLLADDPELAAADLADLAAWLDRVFLHYPDAQVSSCWLWHPTVVEELWWLRCAHAEAYHAETGSWLRVGDWHDRQRPGVAARVRAVLGKCELSRHAPGNGRPAVVTEPIPAPLAEHAASVADEWTRRHAVPKPTDQQLASAQIHQTEQYRKN